MIKLLALSLMILATTAHAGLFRIGAEGGISSANISTNSLTTTVNRSGIAAGGLAEISVLGMVYFQPELLYVQKGFTSTGVFQWDYLELPLLMKVKLGFLPLHFDIFGGPSVALAISKTPGSNIKSLDYGIHVGGGVSIDILDVVGVFAHLRYALGLAEISDIAATSVKNNALLLMAGIIVGGF